MLFILTKHLLTHINLCRTLAPQNSAGCGYYVVHSGAFMGMGGRRRVLHLSCACRCLSLLSNRAITGDVSLWAFECGAAQARLSQPRTIPAIHETVAVGFVSFTHNTSAHVPRRQARNVQGEREWIDCSALTQEFYLVMRYIHTMHRPPRTANECSS